jgi:hypothetical protein
MREFTTAKSVEEILSTFTEGLPQISFDKGAYFLIRELSGEIPYLIYLLAGELIELKNRAKFMRPFSAWDVEQVSWLVVENARHIRQLWEMLSPKEQLAIVSMVDAMGKRNVRWLSLSDLGDSLNKRAPNEDLLSLLQEIIISGLVVMNQEESRFKVRPVLLERWIEKYKPFDFFQSQSDASSRSL